MMEEVLASESLRKAWTRVEANAGAPGIDGMTVEEFPAFCREHWPKILSALMEGTYRPAPVRRVFIPKPDGRKRPLGVPTVLDRLIQQALAQVLTPLFESGFNDHSYGFRAGRNAHQAVRHVEACWKEGRRYAVDCDLAYFFDTVNHDRLMGQLRGKVQDRKVLALIRRYLAAGVVPTLEGLPGDKLTAFAPETVGVRYRSGLSQQIVKQMFDVGELLDTATDLDRVRQAHEASFNAENGFRQGRFRLNDALDDSMLAALRVTQLNLRGEEPWDGRKRRMLLDGIGAINVTLLREVYTVEDARIGASRAGLLAALLRHGRAGSPASYRFVPQHAADLPHELNGRYAVLSPLRETATEAFHNWHQVHLLEVW